MRASFVEKSKLTSSDPLDRIGHYIATTDKSGKATIHALPGKRGQNIELEHGTLELPTLQNAPFHRGVHVDLTPGETTEVNLTLQTKGIEVLGQ